MRHRLSDIAVALDAQLEGCSGCGEITITGAAEPARAGPDDLAMAMTPKYAEALAQGRARAAVLWEGADWRALGLEAGLFVSRPRLAMAALTRKLDTRRHVAPGIHPSALIDPTAKIGAGAAIGPFAVIGAGTRIGAKARIGAHCVIGNGVRIGEAPLLMPGVIIGDDVRIGDRLIVHAGAVIGSDGFSFVTPRRSTVEAVRESLGRAPIATAAPTGEASADPGAGSGGWVRIHSLASVTLGDDVEIGANSCIDRGTIRDTSIGRGSKLDNFVQIGHNVRIGEDCLLCSHVAIAGSSRLGDRVVLGGQCGVSDNITIGDDVVAGGASKIFTNAPAGRALLGAPATRMDTQIAIYKAQRRLPRLMRQVAALQARLRRLAGNADGEGGKD